MDSKLLDQLLQWGTAFDVETEKIQPGLLSPPLVLGSIAQWNGERIVGELLDWRQTLDAFRFLVEDERRIIVGAHLCYDVLVCSVEWARLGVDMMPAIFRMYEQGRAYDVLLAQALHHIAEGHLAKEKSGGDMRDPITGETTNRYSLGIVHHQITGEKSAKANDKYKLSYGMFMAASKAGRLEELPIEARTYPVDDACNTLRDALGQAGHMPKIARHQWGSTEVGESGAAGSVCSRCSFDADSAPGVPMPECWETRRHRNIHALADQTYTSWVMELGAAWGFRVDQAAVDEVEREVNADRDVLAEELLGYGYLKHKREKGVEKLGGDQAAIARAVAEAFGASGRCDKCAGSGKMLSAKAKAVRCRLCRGKDKIVGTCAECAGVGSKTYGPFVNCLSCCATGLDLATCPELMRTDPSTKFPEGQVTASRDALNESGDEKLRALAEYGEGAKTIGTYCPYLRSCRTCLSCGMAGTKKSPHSEACAFAGAAPVYRDVPLTLKPNTLLVTDRTSYSDSIQQFPRSGNLRACIRARVGFGLASVDWNFGELVTHAQSCRWILGYSELGDSLLAGLDPHSELAAKVLAMGYEEFEHRRKKLKDKTCGDGRQAAKPFTFGKPGGMGSPKLVEQNRKNGPDTPCATGPAWIDDGKGGKIRGYKGTRFCILMDGATTCGEAANGGKVREWGREGYERPCKPLCRQCLECADRLGQVWLKARRENRPYFAYASDAMENGMIIPDWYLTLWPELADYCHVDDHGLRRLSPGEVVQHVSGIVRGDVDYCDCCNGWFQSLLGVAAKRALRWAQRECCDASYLVPTDACKGGKVSAYAGQRSPLFGSRCVVLQHDELLAEIILANLHHGATRLSELMVRALQEICPDQAASVKAPPAVMDRWYKGAEDVRSCPTCAKVIADKQCECGLQRDHGTLEFWAPRKKAA